VFILIFLQIKFMNKATRQWLLVAKIPVFFVYPDDGRWCLGYPG
jgi:hypothetical protein